MARDPAIGPVTIYQADGSSQLANVATVEPISIKMPDGGLGDLPIDIPVIILAGGKGTRLMDVTENIVPKAMVTIGGRPILEHIIKIYISQGFQNIIIAGGYLVEEIDKWLTDDREIDRLGANIRLIDTGLETQTAGRLLRLKAEIKTPCFMMTYGDGLADINLRALWLYYAELRNNVFPPIAACLTAAHPPARFGNMDIERGLALRFGEKTQSSHDWINAGFYVMHGAILDIIPGDACSLEYDILPLLSIQYKLGTFQHPGFFQMIDTWRDLQLVREIHDGGKAPWLKWM